MAKVVNLTEFNSLGMPLHIVRENPQPLDKTSFYDSYEKALEYATDTAEDESGKVAYFGQILTVFNPLDKTKNGVYRIDSLESQTVLTKLVDYEELEEKIIEINTGLSNAGYQGSYASLKNKETLIKGMVFNILNSEINDFLNDFAISDIEAGDWLIVKENIPFIDLTKDNFNNYIGVWEKNLTGAATTVTQLTNTESSPDYFISSVTKENESSEIRVVKSQLPVKGVGQNKEVNIESATNIVTGVKLEDNNIVPEVIKINDLNLGNPLHQIYRVTNLYDNITVTDGDSTNTLNDTIIIPIPNIYNVNKIDNNNILMYQNGVFVSTSTLFILMPLSESRDTTIKSNGVEIDFTDCDWYIQIQDASTREIPIDTNDTIDLVFTYLG